MKNKIIRLAAFALSVAALSGSPVVIYAATPFAGVCATNLPANTGTSQLVTSSQPAAVQAAGEATVESTAPTVVATDNSAAVMVAGVSQTFSAIQTTGSSDVVVASTENADDAAAQAEVPVVASDSNAKAAAVDVVNNNTSVVTAEFNDVAIANVENYVNIRSAASEESEVVGKLYNNCMATVVGVEGDWYQISSGSCTGYIKGEYLIVGDATVAKTAGRRIAVVNTETLKVRTAPSTEAEILGLVPIGEDLTVTDESITGWVKVSIEEGEGYVSTDYVELSTEYKYAESIEEERARLAAEEAERQQAAAAAAAAAEANSSKSSSSSSSSSSGSSQSYAPATGSGGSAVASYACQFVGNPYVYGGSSLTNGTDCSGFVMSVYANYGISLPHSSSALRGVGYGVSTSDMQPGDIVCYSGHVGIYIGNGSIVHASTPSSGIKISTAYYREILAVRRIF